MRRNRAPGTRTERSWPSAVPDTPDLGAGFRHSILGRTDVGSTPSTGLGPECPRSCDSRCRDQARTWTHWLEAGKCPCGNQGELGRTSVGPPEGLNDQSWDPASSSSPPRDSPVPPTPSQPSLLQPDSRAAVNPYPSPTELSIPGALLHPSLPTCPAGGARGSVPPASSSSSHPARQAGMPAPETGPALWPPPAPNI